MEKCDTSPSLVWSWHLDHEPANSWEALSKTPCSICTSIYNTYSQGTWTVTWQEASQASLRTTGYWIWAVTDARGSALPPKLSCGTGAGRSYLMNRIHLQFTDIFPRWYCWVLKWTISPWNMPGLSVCFISVWWQAKGVAHGPEFSWDLSLLYLMMTKGGHLGCLLRASLAVSLPDNSS